MKIKKLVESKLVEADEDIKPGDEGLAEVNPQQDSVADIADGVKDEVSITSDGEKEISQADATKAAAEIKDTAKDVNAGKVAFVPSDEDFNSIVIKNRLTDILDNALENSKYFMGEGIKAGSNVLIEGLPGSGKTAIVETWCKSKGLKLVAVNATDPKLETAVNGMPLRDVTKPDQNAVTTARSDLLADLMDPANNGNCVLFVDEFNRQRDQQLRRVFLSLFNEKRNADGSLNFTKTLLFSIVCINPAGQKYHDKGTDQLNQAERTRFADDITDFDSTPEESLEFFKGNLVKRLLKLGVVAPGTPVAEKHNFSGPYKELTEDDLRKIDIELKIYSLANYLLDNAEHPYIEFTFDTRDDLAEINDYNKQLFNSRKLTDLLYGSLGDVDKFLNKIDVTSNLRDATKKMIHDILENYPGVDIKELRKEFGVTANEPEDEEAAEDIAADIEDTTAQLKDDNIEDDMDLFNQQPASGTGTSTVIDPASLIDDVNDTMAGW